MVVPHCGAMFQVQLAASSSIDTSGFMAQPITDVDHLQKASVTNNTLCHRIASHKLDSERIQLVQEHCKIVIKNAMSSGCFETTVKNILRQMLTLTYLVLI